MLVFSMWPSSLIACHWFFTCSCCKHLYYCWLLMPVCFLPGAKWYFGCVRCSKIYKSSLVWGVKLSWSGLQKWSRDYKVHWYWKTLCFSSCSFWKQSLTWLIFPLPVCLECKVVLDSMHTPGFNSRISSFDQNLGWGRKISKI